jgi:hypothetical protein
MQRPWVVVQFKYLFKIVIPKRAVSREESALWQAEADFSPIKLARNDNADGALLPNYTTTQP